MSEVEMLPEASMGRRERKKLNTRRALRRAALELALERGVEHLVVEDITDAVDVSPRTFFNYFACKEDALIDHTAGAGTELRAAILASPCGTAPLETLRGAINRSEFLRRASLLREESLTRQRLVHSTPSLLARQLGEATALEAAIAEAMAARMRIDPELDMTPQLLGALAGSVLRVALRRWSADGSDLHGLVDEAFSLLSSRLDPSFAAPPIAVAPAAPPITTHRPASVPTR